MVNCERNESPEGLPLSQPVQRTESTVLGFGNDGLRRPTRDFDHQSGPPVGVVVGGFKSPGSPEAPSSHSFKAWTRASSAAGRSLQARSALLRTLVAKPFNLQRHSLRPGTSSAMRTARRARESASLGKFGAAARLCCTTKTQKRQVLNFLCSFTSLSRAVSCAARPEPLPKSSLQVLRRADSDLLSSSTLHYLSHRRSGLWFSASPTGNLGYPPREKR